MDNGLRRADSPWEPTIVDVARLANVHHTTASRALRGMGRIHVATVLRVRAAAAELGYSPDPVARILKSRDRRQRLVGVALDPESMTGITRKAQTFWFFFLVELTSRLSDAKIGIVQIMLDDLPALDGMPVDLIIVVSITNAPIVLPPSMESIPLVADRGHSPDDRIRARMGHDHAAIAEAACDHLADRGATRVAFLPLSDRDIISVAAARGYFSWCQRRGEDVRVLRPYEDRDLLRRSVRVRSPPGSTAYSPKMERSWALLTHLWVF